MIQLTKEQIRELIRSDEVNKNLNIAHQNWHIRESGSYRKGRGYLFFDIDEVKLLIEQYHGTGEIRLSKSGKWINKEFITLNKDIGVHIDGSTGVETITNTFAIHYSKQRGAHIVPSRRRQ